jgi:putative ABC transport system substrate-binding protein
MRIAPLAMELIERKVDVIIPVSPAAVRAALAASATIPIVALDLESDPVASGLIQSFSRPGAKSRVCFLIFLSSAKNGWNC